jgi:serine/threonine protein kinase/Tol biopolymer transport system component
MVGRRVAHYEISERLGEGGMGVVYKALDLRLDRSVALKLISPRLATGGEGRRRFEREARAASALDHPNVCAVYELGESEEGDLFLAMAFCPGETLKARIARGILPAAEALDIAAQIAAGLGAAHERGIIHRDVKPANVILSPQGLVKLVDFGIAKLAEGETVLTRQDRPLGTLAYMSPEQLRGQPVDARSDIWSLGVVLYEMLTGGPPFAGADRELVRAILADEPAPLAARLPGTSEMPGIERILRRALAKRTGERYRDIERMRRELLEAAAGRALPDVDVTLIEPAREAADPPSGVAGLAGRRILHFQVLEPVGSGGMGVVYRAEDTRLGRTVALKFLAPELGRNMDAKQRFLTEARAASALDHPNVCTILEVGESADGLLFLAMPCYAGEDLQSRIARGPLPLAEAVDIAAQTAQGLAKAHRHGIIHRDLKPANLFLTADGLVKILDFGLAKLAGAAALTRRGSFLGTPAYMAPEQTRGEEVDARADVWSLGVALYEMLTGRRPFNGGAAQAVIYAVLHTDPEAVERLRPEVPPELARLIHRLIAKDPRDRPADANEVLRELRLMQGQPGSGTRTAPVDAAPGRRLPKAVTLGLAVALTGAAVAGLVAWRRGGPETAGGQMTFTRLTDMAGRESFPSLSPDGNFFVYVAAVNGDNRDVFLQRVGGGNPIDLTGDSAEDDTQPAFSPDGRQIAFRSEREGGGIFLMGATGESVRRLTNFGFNPAWSPDGREIAVASEGVTTPFTRRSSSRIFRVDVATGASRPVPVEDGVQPSWSPHGLRLAYWGLAGPANRVIWTVPADGGPPVQVTDDAFYNWSPVWSPDGAFLYFASDRGGSMNLWRVPVDEASGRILGAPQPLTTPSESSATPSFARDGRRVLYATDDSRSFLETVPLDPGKGRTAGPPALVFEGSRSLRGCDVSPDGASIVFRTAAPQEDLYLIRADGRDLRQLTDDPARDRAPRWSPDGRRILFSSNRSGKYEAWTIRPDGSGLTQVTRAPGESVNNPIWSPDGRRIAFTYGSHGTSLLDLDRPSASPHRLSALPGGQVFAATSWSGDGRWLTGFFQRQDRMAVPGVVLWSLADGTQRRLTSSGSESLFLHNGSRILFFLGDSLWTVDRESGAARELLSPPAHSSYLAANPGPDDRLCTVRSTDEGDVWLLTQH